ncbi:MAG: response regulator, partial [Pseudomonadales bacterium]
DAKFIGNVLLVDDNSINLELAQILLRKTGLTITTASDGAEAVAAEKENSFDLIFMDIEMPVLNGTEATVQIRAGGRNSDIPIIALTANVSEDDIAFYLSKGMTDSLTKPVATEAMIELLARYLPYTLEDKLALEAASAMQQEDPGELMLDSDTLNNLLNDIGAENAERVINMYIDDTSKQMGTLVRYMQSGDRENTRKVAHRLASSSLSFGLNKLGNSLRQIEKFAKEDQAFDAIDADGLESLFADSKAALIKAFKSD